MVSFLSKKWVLLEIAAGNKKQISSSSVRTLKILAEKVKCKHGSQKTHHRCCTRYRLLQNCHWYSRLVVDLMNDTESSLVSAKSSFPAACLSKRCISWFTHLLVLLLTRSSQTQFVKRFCAGLGGRRLRYHWLLSFCCISHYCSIYLYQDFLSVAQ